MEKIKVTFLGLGAMGNGIATNILKGGHDLTVWNRPGSARWENGKVLESKGARLCSDIAEAVRDAEIVGMCLTNNEAVKDVCEQIYPHVSKGTVIFDCSTTSPGTAQKMADKFKAKGVFFLDSPVSGGIAGAEAGTLTLMIGGDSEAYKKAEPVIKSCSGSYDLMGPSGAGQSTKLINQMLTAVNQAAACEAMLIAEKAGLDLAKLYDLLITAWGNSTQLQRTVKTYIIPKKFESAACLQLMLKDLGYIKDMADELGYTAPLTEITSAFFNKAKDEGYGKEDLSAIIKIMETDNKI
jgi:3-hydroxyisobutyrate dehydrogenase-like beta-hydroxyacid dehydrogenase